MKTIEEMFQEWWKNTQDSLHSAGELDVVVRQAFFAGFNRMYNLANSGGILELPLTFNQFEKEMDEHSETIT
jgi:hypothetical protein